MNPLTRLFRRSRAFRLVLYLLLVPLWGFIVYISLNSFAKYTEVGNMIVLTLIVLFAIWAWWYSEDRDRRRARGVDQADGDGAPTASDGRRWPPT
jgi:hypothetical protein